ncbi:MAG: hypothetical protein HOJ15_03505 [Candidatus Jacksonbacteria bacterium]|jgi:hypothetical protein|nr:hypothetical protein [Candidatus Jacksonbacteria bacterium]MBT6034497.1 hypothetical protein [Candidatus Jacksonbacteria bacterium]MBT6301465.1 hypothetical protein [Candidatus Jacksonbacteria bacterium]MBT6757806.1 hypothetical protein [Candidatus Jacksonbacteria bacterium]MBT6955145.1 hypothetical protein [Candidatus Jacksonbacteria bacterium]
MSKPTFGQANRLLTLIQDQNLTRKQIQDLLGSSLLVDLLSADQSAIARDEFRLLLGLPPLVTHEVRTLWQEHLPEVLEPGNRDWLDTADDVLGQIAPLPGEGDDTISVSIFHFDRVMTKVEVENLLGRQGLRPAVLWELVALGVEWPRLREGVPIVALGSTWDNTIGLQCPWLDTGCLGLVPSDTRLSERCRFAAVPNTS